MKKGAQITNVMVNQGKKITFTLIITDFKEYEVTCMVGFRTW